MTDATNGQQPRDAATITAEVIKKNGLDVAQEIRELAKRAREEGEAMAQFAEQVAGDIIQSSSHAAERISGYLDRCTAARASVEGHKNTLADLPEHNKINEGYAETNEALKAYVAVEQRLSTQYENVEQALGKLMLQDK